MYISYIWTLPSTTFKELKTWKPNMKQNQKENKSLLGLISGCPFLNIENRFDFSLVTVAACAHLLWHYFRLASHMSIQIKQVNAFIKTELQFTLGKKHI